MQGAGATRSEGAAPDFGRSCWHCPRPAHAVKGREQCASCCSPAASKRLGISILQVIEGQEVGKACDTRDSKQQGDPPCCCGPHCSPAQAAAPQLHTQHHQYSLPCTWAPANVRKSQLQLPP